MTPNGFLQDVDDPWTGGEKQLAAWLVDTDKHIILFVDDGQPEDRYLDRNYQFLVTLLNKHSSDSK